MHKAVAQMERMGLTYYYTPKAAEIVRDTPSALLAHRLYHVERSGPVLLTKDGAPLCVFKTKDYQNLGNLGMPSIGTVHVAAPDEVLERAVVRTVEIGADYPSPKIPFELEGIKADMEEARERFSLSDGEGGLSTFYLGACPFDAYKIFHFLTRYNTDLRDEIASIRRMAEVGSGLGIASFVASQFLHRSAQVQGLDVNEELIRQAYQIRSMLSLRQYPLSNVLFCRADIRSFTPSRSFDALIGWFPLGKAFTREEMQEIFLRLLRKGGLVFQMYSDNPIFYEGTSEFRPVDIYSGASLSARLPVKVFQKV